MSTTGYEIYREDQRLPWWTYLIVCACAVPLWWLFLEQIVRGNPSGDNPSPNWLVWLMFLGLGIALPAGFLFLRLSTVVYPDRLLVQWRPLAQRELRPSDVASFRATTYRPLREYGGWGVRGRAKSARMAYNARGDRGVELTLTDGRIVMIGTQTPDRLAGALRTAGFRSPDPNNHKRAS